MLRCRSIVVSQVWSGGYGHGQFSRWLGLFRKGNVDAKAEQCVARAAVSGSARK